MFDLVKQFAILPAFFLIACSTNLHKDINRLGENISKLETGAIIHQRSKELGDGFFEVKRSQINPPDYWEGIGVGERSTYLLCIV